MISNNRKGFFFLEALVAMVLVSVVLGGTLTSLTRAGAVSQGNKSQFTELILCEELMENLRHQWFSISSTDRGKKFVDQGTENPFGEIETDRAESGWRSATALDERCPWPATLTNIYSGQYRIQPLLTDLTGELYDDKRRITDKARVEPGTLFQLEVRVRLINQDEVVSLVTFLPCGK